MAKSTTFEFSSRRDFGLGNFRLALPDERNPQQRSRKLGGEKRSPKETSGGFGGRVKSLFKSQKRGKNAVGDSERSSPVFYARNNDALDHGSSRAGSGARPSPSLHHRVVGGGAFLLGSEGVRGSLENLKKQYSLETEDGTEQRSNPVYKKDLTDLGVLIQLTIRPQDARESNDVEEQRITLQKNPDGLGLQLSTGPPPVLVKYVDPGSQAANAGIKKGDQIVEVNGKSCRTMLGLEWPELMKMKSLLQRVSLSSLVTKPNEVSDEKGSKKNPTITSIDDFDLEDSSEDDQAEHNTQETAGQAKQDSVDEIKDIHDAFEEAIKVLAEDGPEEGVDIGKFEESKGKHQISKREVTAAPPLKVELGDKEWRQMMQKQQLVFGDAPSDLINKQQQAMRKNVEVEVSPQQETVPKIQGAPAKKDLSKESKHEAQKHRKKSKGSASNDTKEQQGRSSSLKRSKSVTTVSTPSVDGNETNDIPVKVSSSGMMKGPSSKSGSRRASIIDVPIEAPTDEIHAFKGELENAMSVLLVARNESLLGVSVGRSKRDVGVTRAEMRRRPPTRNHLQERASCTEDFLFGTEKTQPVNMRPRAWTLSARQRGNADEVLVDPKMNKSSYLPQKQPSFSSTQKHRNEIKELLREKPSSKQASQTNPNRLSREIVAEAAAFKKRKSTGNIQESESITTLISKAESTLNSSNGKVSQSSSSARHGRFFGFAALIDRGTSYKERPETSTKMFQRPTPKPGTTRDHSTSTTVQPSVTKETEPKNQSHSELPVLGNVKSKMAMFERS